MLSVEMAPNQRWWGRGCRRKLPMNRFKERNSPRFYLSAAFLPFLCGIFVFYRLSRLCIGWLFTGFSCILLTRNFVYICVKINTIMAENTIHQGRNIKRFREMLGVKQDALAMELGDDWNQQKVSLLEQRE